MHLQDGRRPEAPSHPAGSDRTGDLRYPGVRHDTVLLFVREAEGCARLTKASGSDS